MSLELFLSSFYLRIISFNVFEHDQIWYIWLLFLPCFSQNLKDRWERVEQDYEHGYYEDETDEKQLTLNSCDDS